MAETIPRSNLDPNSATWGRWVTDKITNFVTEVDRNTTDQGNLNKQLNSSIKTLSEQINNLPYVTTAGSDAGNGSLNASWDGKNTIVIPIPTGKTRASVMAIVNAQYLDVSTGGAAVAQGRIFIGKTPLVGGENGDYSRAVSAAKDAGASVVNNILNIGFSDTLTGLDIDRLDPNIYITFQALATNGTAYPAQTSNFSQLSVQVTFNN